MVFWRKTPENSASQLLRSLIISNLIFQEKTQSINLLAHFLFFFETLNIYYELQAAVSVEQHPPLHILHDNEMRKQQHPPTHTSSHHLHLASYDVPTHV